LSPEPSVTSFTILLVAVLGAFTGALGALLGIGGGVFLVPLLILTLGLPLPQAAGISLLTVIATSSAVSSVWLKRGFVNVRLGMVLETVTSAGALAGGLSSALLSERTLRGLFAAATMLIAVLMLSRIEKRNVIADTATPPGWFGGRFFDLESQQEVVYRLRRAPVAFAASFVAGNLSGLLGIGGGIIKVPVLNVWCGIPIRTAAATSAFMLGVTVLASLPIYYARGQVIPAFAAAAVVGVQVGTRAGLWISERARAKWLKVIMAAVLVVVSGLMLWRG